MGSFKIALRWFREREFKYELFNRNHDIVFSGNQTLKNSAAVEYFGNDNTSNPEELLASALASCHMLTFLAVACKMGFVVQSYEDDAVAILDKNEEGKLAVTSITLHPKIIFEGNEPDPTKLQDMHNKAHRNCFIAQSIKAKVDVII